MDSRSYKRSPPAFDPSFYRPRYWPTWMALGILWLLARLPLRLMFMTGNGLGRLLYHIAPARRRIAEINIGLCFPELSATEQQQLVRRIVQSVAIGSLESARALWGPDSAFSEGYTIEGLEHIRTAQVRGQGVLLVGGHYTTLDAAARILARHIPYDMLYRKDPNPLLAWKITRAREAIAGEAILRSNTRQLVRNLREGHVVWYAPDQDYGRKHSVFAPFFNVPAATVFGTSRFARLGKAVVLPLYHYRDHAGHYHLNIGVALDDFPSGDEESDAARINGVIEANIRQHPDQYLWVHRRFKTRPEGLPPVYPRKK